MKERFVRLAILVIGFGLIVNLSRDLSRLSRAGDQIKLAEGKLEELEKEHRGLLEKKDFYQSEEFVEEEARNKLNMSYVGETVVILPPNLGQLLGQTETKPVPQIPNWKRWWQLFF